MLAKDYEAGVLPHVQLLVNETNDSTITLKQGSGTCEGSNAFDHGREDETL